MTGRKRLAARFVLLAGGLGAGLLIAEVGLRFAGISYPLPYYPDPHVGSRLKPGFAAWFTKEGRALVRVNSAGFRDREHEVAKPPGTLRIAVLGDSFAEAVQVPQELTFWSRLESELDDSPALGGKRVEVLNFGVSGHGTAQQLQMLRHHVWRYAPDIVLLAFFAGNDIRNNSRELEPDHVRPFFVLNGGKLELDDSFREHPDFLAAQSRLVAWKVRLINSSRVLQLVNELRSRASHRRIAHDTEEFETGLDDGYLKEPAAEEWQQAWEVTERLVEQIAVETRRHQARFVVVMVPRAVQVHPNRDLRKRFAARWGVPDLRHAERRMAALGREIGFDVIELASPMARRAVRSHAYFHGFSNTEVGAGHWNAAGHGFAAKIIAARLLDILTAAEETAAEPPGDAAVTPAGRSVRP